MLEETNGLSLDKLLYHVRKDGSDGVEPLVRLTDVTKSDLVEEDLLHDEDRDRLRELRTGLHDPQTEGDDLSREKEVDNVAVVVLLDERTDDAEGGEAEVLKRTGLRGRVKERIEEKGDVGAEEEGAGVVVRSDALEEGEGVANTVRGVSSKGGRGEERVDGDDFLQKSRHDA
jgi:hypothetical protein